MLPFLGLEASSQSRCAERSFWSFLQRKRKPGRPPSLVQFFPAGCNFTSCWLSIPVRGVHLHSSGPHALPQKLFCSPTVKFPFHELFNKQLKFYLEISLLGIFFFCFRSYQDFKLCFNVLKRVASICAFCLDEHHYQPACFFFFLVRMSLVQIPSLLLTITSLNSLSLHFHTFGIGTIQVLSLLKCWGGGRRGNDVIDLILASAW